MALLVQNAQLQQTVLRSCSAALCQLAAGARWFSTSVRLSYTDRQVPVLVQRQAEYSSAMTWLSMYLPL